MAKAKFHERWGDRKIMKKGNGVVILERATIDIVVAYDVDDPRKQKPRFFTMMGGSSRGEAMKAAASEFQRRQK